MRSRRLACLLLGMWLAGSLVAAWAFLNTRRTADDMVAARNPAATLRLKSLTPLDSSLVLRYAAWEDARARLETSGWTEFVVGVAFFFFLLFGTGEGMAPLVLALFMLTITAAQAFLLNPGLISLGRLTDFIAPAADAGDRGKLAVLEVCLVGTEAVKFLAGIALAAFLIRQSRRKASGGAWDQLNLVDKTNHSHIDR